MTTTRTTPLLQVRVIGPAEHAQVLTVDLVHRAEALLGSGVQYRTHTRPARRIGYVRIYVTVTRKEVHAIGEP
jgi:hypothetical protein